MKKILIGSSALLAIMLLNGCETKASKFAEEETNRCMAEELNKLEKPFYSDNISKVRNECGTYVNELMQDMKPNPGE